MILLTSKLIGRALQLGLKMKRALLLPQHSKPADKSLA